MGEEVGRKFGMPLDKFTADAYAGLAGGEEEIYVGMISPAVDPDYRELVRCRRNAITGLTRMMLHRL
jgi:hypothetical protein